MCVVLIGVQTKVSENTVCKISSWQTGSDFNSFRVCFNAFLMDVCVYIQRDQVYDKALLSKMLVAVATNLK